MNDNTKLSQYLRAILLIIILGIVLNDSVFAMDKTGVTGLDEQITTFEDGVKVFAKWGGILLIAIGGWMVGSGKAHGDMAGHLARACIGIGLVTAAWAWFGDSFANGLTF